MLVQLYFMQQLNRGLIYQVTELMKQLRRLQSMWKLRYFFYSE